MGQVSYIKGKQGKEELRVLYPVRFASKEGEKVQISGSIDFGLGLTFRNTPTDEKIMWRLDLTRSPTSTVSGFKCSGSKKCDQIK